MIAKKALSAWAFPSSQGTTSYEVVLWNDGSVSCNCPGWIYNKARICKHTKIVADEAKKILSGEEKPVFQKIEKSVVNREIKEGKRRIF